jgi:hypothetical protein
MDEIEKLIAAGESHVQYCEGFARVPAHYFYLLAAAAKRMREGLEKLSKGANIREGYGQIAAEALTEANKIARGA